MAFFPNDPTITVPQKQNGKQEVKFRVKNKNKAKNNIAAYFLLVCGQVRLCKKFLP